MDTAPADGAPRGARPGLPRALWLLLAAAASLRLAYLIEYAVELPFAYGPMGDSVVYLRQAQQILRGELGTPEQLALSPLYGYFLAAVTDGTPGLLPLGLQALLGLVQLGLVFVIARAWSGEARVGVIAAALAAGYAPLVFLESKLLAETLGLSLALAATALYVGPGFRRGDLRHALGCGALLGLSVLARASFLFALPCFALFALARFAEADAGARARVLRAGALAAGIGIVLLSWGAWNARNAGQFVPVILVAQTLESAARAQDTGSMRQVAQGAGLPSSFDVVTQARARLAAPDAREEPGLVARVLGLDYGALLASIPGKWAATLSYRERFFQYGFLGERSTIAALRVLPVSIGALEVLALAQLLALGARRRLRSVIPLLPWLLGALATTAVYLPSTRYRLPMVIPLLVLAAAGSQAPRLLATARARTAAALALALAVAVPTLAFVTQGPGNAPEWHLQLAGSCYNAGFLPCADAEAARALQAAPSDPTVRARVEMIRRGIRLRTGG